MARCRSCQAEVTWALTEEGKRMPLDAAPTPAGNLEIVSRSSDGTPRVRVLAQGEVPADRYLSHFATCRDAGQWRRK